MAIIKDGELAAKHVWGYANIDTREPITPQTIFPICSISKQMVCLVLTELITERGTQFEQAVLQTVREMLPDSISTNEDLTLERLVGMQSGLRDYWILSVLWGARPQDRFSIYQDAPEALKRLGRFQFAPGTQFSYSNTNFMVVGLAIEKVTGQTLNDLLQSLLFKPAGMKSAGLRADMARIPSPIVGYEGSEETGYIPYTNRIEWAGDAGVSASLDDMIAYEKYIHRSSTDENSAYFKIATDPTYIHGSSAHYSNGLFHREVEGVKVVEHSGGLAGFRLRRSYMPSERTSVIVLLNSHIDTTVVASYTFKKILKDTPSIEKLQVANDKPAETRIEVKWTSSYLDEETKLAVVVKQDKPGQVIVNYDGHHETLEILNENEAKGNFMQVRFGSNGLSVVRPFENRRFTARPLRAVPASTDAQEFVGRYYSKEIDSTLLVSGSGAMLYGAFDGYLGKGPMHVMQRLGEDVWWLACFRSLDAPVPGYWTVAFDGRRFEGFSKVTVGCMGARDIAYQRVS
ncbi:hypothetical protein LTS08_002357 [Lithohypha guttulata]|nr:hypothetical protein LTS08_002357 [Lithohypha guttulata]